MWVVVPEGKELHIKTGNYRFKGPKFIPIASRYHFPETYTDGTSIEVTDDPNKPRPTPNPSPQVRHRKKVRTEGEGSDSRLRGRSDLQPDTGKKGKSSVLRSELRADESTGTGGSEPITLHGGGTENTESDSQE